MMSENDVSAARWSSRRRQMGAAAVCGVWLAAIAGGTWALWGHQHAAGAPATAPIGWPAGTTLERSAEGRSTLLLFAHPQCPCTRASVRELMRVVAQGGDRVSATIVLSGPLQPTGEAFDEAARSPGVRIVRDPAGTEARRFGAVTSGQVFVYDASGRLTFSGGITGSRGHEGDNAGEDAIVRLILGDNNKASDGAVVRSAPGIEGTALMLAPMPVSSAVFGCPILDVNRTGVSSQSASLQDEKLQP